MTIESNRMALLQQMPLFGGIRGDIVEFLLSLSTGVSVPRDAYFFREGDQGEAMYLLESGRVAIIKQAHAAPVVLRQLGPGECFGEMALVTFRRAVLRSWLWSTAKR